MRTSWLLGVAVSLAGASACGGEDRAPHAASQSVSSSASPAPGAATPGASAEATASTVVTASAAVTASAEATATPSASAAASASAAPAELPAVTVKNIGMHIGGGPNDDATKAPIKRSVARHFEQLRACFSKAADQDKQGDVSVDLKIQKAGGQAEVQKFKSALKGEGFETCIRDVFLAIDFEKPKTGTTVVSYSLRFTPDKKK